jgi:hypothetical protein
MSIGLVSFFYFSPAHAAYLAPEHFS